MIEWVTRTVRTRAGMVAALLVVAGAVLLSATHTWYYTELSPVDELQHIDYLYRAPDVVHAGEKVGQDAMREQACRVLPNWPSPECDEDTIYDTADFQEEGTNTASIYTPLYYTLTKVLATPLTWVLGEGSLVTAARLVGGLYLAAGLLVTFVVARRFGARPYPTAAILLAAAATPNVLVPSATITPDAVALLVGASLVWSVLWWEEAPRWRWWLPALLGVLTVLFKAINVIVVVLVALYVVLRYLHGRLWPDHAEAGRDPDRPGLAHAVVLVGVVSVLSLAGAAGYVFFTQATAANASEGISMAEQVRASAFPVEGFLTHFGAFLQVFYSPGAWVTTPLIGPFVQTLVGLLVFAGTFAAAFLLERVRSTARLLGISLLVVGLVGAPLIIAFSYFSAGMYVPIPGRYALTLVPAGLAVAAATVQRRPARVFVGLAGTACYLAVLGWMVVFAR